MPRLHDSHVMPFATFEGAAPLISPAAKRPLGGRDPGTHAAAAASVATSQPAPDWTIEDTATGELTLSPDVDETFVHLHVSSQRVASQLSMEVALDPPPTAPRTINEAADTPILLFVGVPTVVTPGVALPATRLEALPKSFGRQPDGFEQTPGAAIPLDGDEKLDIRVTWKSTLEDRLQSTTEQRDGTTVTSSVERPVALRREVKIRWRARVHVEGDGDRPAGTVDVAPAS